eukprot:2658097-Prymnesium_polylepis.1
MYYRGTACLLCKFVGPHGSFGRRGQGPRAEVISAPATPRRPTNTLSHPSYRPEQPRLTSARALVCIA